MAQAAMQEYHLDKVIFLTSGNPPHKRGKKILDAKIRHIMVKRAIKDAPSFEPCDWEVLRAEYSYTLTTLLHFKEIYDILYYIYQKRSYYDKYCHTWIRSCG